MKRVLLVSTLLILELVALAQTASVRGTVVDQSQALIPGVTVQLEHLDRGEKLTTVTDDSGRFAFLGVSPGNVRITATLPGFQIRTINLGVGATGAVVNLTLDIASVATQVEVTVSSPAYMTTSSASVGQVISPGRRPQLRAVNGGFRRMN